MAHSHGAIDCVLRTGGTDQNYPVCIFVVEMSFKMLSQRFVWMGSGLRSIRFLSDASQSISRTFASTSFYSPSVCMSVSLSAPKFQRRPTYLNLQYPGTILFQFVARDSSGKFDWNVKERIALVPVEVATVISMNKPFCITRSERPAATNTLDEVEKPPRELRFFPSPDGRCTIQLEKLDPLNNKKVLEVTLSVGEFSLLTQLLTWSIPRLTGWEQVYESQKASNSSSPETDVTSEMSQKTYGWDNAHY